MADSRDDMLLEALTGLFDVKFKQLSVELNEMMDEKIAKLEEKMDRRFSQIEKRLDRMETDVQELKTCTDKEIRPRIQTLYEITIPLSEKYKTHEKEVQDLKIDMSLTKVVLAEHTKKFEKMG
jgi:hypothetical protein